MFQKGEDFVRVRRGVSALIDGWKQGSVLDRLHASVRALDGLLSSTKGAGERQFAERVAVIADGSRLHDMALEIYRLHSFQEHLSDWPSKLGYIKPDDRAQFVSRRSFQAELLAGAACRAVLTDATLRQEFRDSNLDAFWTRTGAWTAKIQLDAMATRFRHSAST